MSNDSKLDKLVATARESYAKREDGYRQRSLKLYPWVCGRCMREFDTTTHNPFADLKKMMDQEPDK